MLTVILAGGLGMRLRKVVNDIPKPMVPVAGRPFLEYQILQLKSHNIVDIVMCVGYLAGKIKKYFGSGTKWEVKIRYSEEKEPLGTGGAIKLCEVLVKDNDFLVLNGDSYLDIDLGELISFHKRHHALATLALLETDKPARYGVVELDESNRITHFREKSISKKLSLINGGIYVFSKKLFDFIPEGKSSLEREVFPKLVGNRFYGKVHSAFFIDVGTPRSYNRIQKEPWKLRGKAASTGG